METKLLPDAASVRPDPLYKILLEEHGNATEFPTDDLAKTEKDVLARIVEEANKFECPASFLSPLADALRATVERHESGVGECPEHGAVRIAP